MSISRNDIESATRDGIKIISVSFATLKLSEADRKLSRTTGGPARWQLQRWRDAYATYIEKFRGNKNYLVQGDFASRNPCNEIPLPTKFKPGAWNVIEAEAAGTNIAVGLILEHLGKEVKVIPKKTEVFTGKIIQEPGFELVDKQDDETEEESSS